MEDALTDNIVNGGIIVTVFTIWHAPVSLPECSEKKDFLVRIWTDHLNGFLCLRKLECDSPVTIFLCVLVSHSIPCV